MNHGNKLLLIYNISGFKHDNTEKYIGYLQNIREQEFDGELRVVISAYKPRQRTLDILREIFPEFPILVINGQYPVNVTCNLACLEARRHWGDFSAYTYQTCDAMMDTNTILQETFDIMKANPNYGIVAPQIDRDTCYAYGLKLGGGRHQIDAERARVEMFKDGTDYIVPVGRACASHILMYRDTLVDFYGRMIPDIFASHCTESVFTFVAAALKTNWVILKDQSLSHGVSMDGPSWDHRPENRVDLEGNPLPHYDHPLKEWEAVHGPSYMEKIFKNPTGISCGMGFEECSNIVNHDPSQFDDNHFCINDDLKYFIRDNVYVGKDILDYSKIECEWID